MSESISAYAERAGISLQRARELARQGKIKAHKEGRAWVVTTEVRTVPTRRALSHSSQIDLLKFLSTRRFDHVKGHPKTRLASRVRVLRAADNPAALLREYFGNSDLPEGRGGASIVRAAMLHKDAFVKDVLNEITLPENLPSPKDVARKISYMRTLEGLTEAQAADRTNMSLAAYQVLEQQGAARLGNITAMRALRALGAPAPSLIKAKTLVDEVLSRINMKTVADVALANAGLSKVAEDALARINTKTMADVALANAGMSKVAEEALARINTKTMADVALANAGMSKVAEEILSRISTKLVPDVVFANPNKKAVVAPNECP